MLIYLHPNMYRICKHTIIDGLQKASKLRPQLWVWISFVGLNCDKCNKSQKRDGVLLCNNTPVSNRRSLCFGN